MNSFWCNMVEYLRDRRFGSVFFGTLMALSGLLAARYIIWQIIVGYGLQGYVIYSWPVFGVAFLVWFGRMFNRNRMRRLDRYKSSPMSRDELNKARTKLLGGKR